MEDVSEKIAFWENRSTIEALLMIKTSPGKKKTNYVKTEDGVVNKTLFNRLGELMDRGFVSYIVVDGKETRNLTLTEKGEKAAKALYTLFSVPIE